jgi:hypothetical protein
LGIPDKPSQGIMGETQYLNKIWQQIDAMQRTPPEENSLWDNLTGTTSRKDAVTTEVQVAPPCETSAELSVAGMAEIKKISADIAKSRTDIVYNEDDRGNK